MARRTNNFELDAGLFLLGSVVGLVAGGVVGLLNAPRSGVATRNRISRRVTETGDSVRSTVERVAPSDPVGESIAEGKAAARRRRAELGLPAVE